jgi:hypothetical protein
MLAAAPVAATLNRRIIIALAAASALALFHSTEGTGPLLPG